MRTAILVLAAGVIVAALLAACRTRDESVADSTTDDSARADGTATDSGTTVIDTAPGPLSAEPQTTPRARRPETRRVQESPQDSTLPPEDSIRAMRPRLPQVTPETRPRTWRGFKLPEEMPVRIPLETIRRVEQRPDSVTKPDSTKPPKPNR